MSAYQGVPGGPRDPATPGGYCLTICRCGDCPQYGEQQRHADLLREQEYQQRRRRELERAQHPHRRTATVTPLAPTDTITDRWRLFDAKNPHVRARLVELVELAVARGERRIGIGALFEQLRWTDRTETNGDHYRLNSSYRALYVRALIVEHPAWERLFELRARRAS